MSAPDTNTEVQARRHKWPLYAIGAALLFGAVMFLSIFSTAVDDDAIGGADDPVMMKQTEGS
jgi:hypothetical protein